MAHSNHPLAGSERTAMHGARLVGTADPNERLEVTVIVRRPASSNLAHHLTQAAAGKFLTRDEFAKAHGADRRISTPLPLSLISTI